MSSILLTFFSVLTYSPSSFALPSPSHPHSPQLHLYLSSLAASDYRYPSTLYPNGTHALGFTISNPSIGANGNSSCSVDWPGTDARTCYTPCLGLSADGYAIVNNPAEFFVRISPRQNSGYVSAAEWTLEVVEWFLLQAQGGKHSGWGWIDKAVRFRDGEEGYFCFIEEDERTVCGITTGPDAGREEGGRNVSVSARVVGKKGGVEIC